MPAPRTAAYTSTEDGRSTSSAAVTFRLAASSSGPFGAHVCQASITAPASENGHERWTLVASGAGTGRKTRDVTTPKLPQLAPRSAQNRSSSWCSSHMTTRPSARTISAPASESEVTPYVRPRIPSPPPSVRPDTPTDGQVPPGMVTPCSCSIPYTSPRLAPAPTVARSSKTVTVRMGVTSTSTPRVEECPPKLCPPARTARSSP